MPGYVIGKMIDTWSLLLDQLSGFNYEHNIEGYYINETPDVVVLFTRSTGDVLPITTLDHPSIQWYSIATSRLKPNVFRAAQALRPIPESDVYERLIVRYINQSFWNTGIIPFHEIVVKDLRYREELHFTKTIVPESSRCLTDSPPPQFFSLCSAFWYVYHSREKPKNIVRAFHELLVNFASRGADTIEIPATTDLTTLLIFAQGLGVGYQEITNNILDTLAEKKL